MMSDAIAGVVVDIGKTEEMIINADLNLKLL